MAAGSISGISSDMVYASPVFDDTGEMIPNPYVDPASPYFDPGMGAVGVYPEYEAVVPKPGKEGKVPMDNADVGAQGSAMNVYVPEPGMGAMPEPRMGAMASPPDYEVTLPEKS